MGRITAEISYFTVLTIWSKVQVLEIYLHNLCKLYMCINYTNVVCHAHYTRGLFGRGAGLAATLISNKELVSASQYSGQYSGQYIVVASSSSQLAARNLELRIKIPR